VVVAINERGDYMVLEVSWAMLRFIAMAAIAALLVSMPARAQESGGVLGTMTPQEREAAGLNKLSAEEQLYLDTWLRQRLSSGESPAAMNSAAQAVTPPDPDGSVVETGGDTSDAAMEAEIERRVAIEVEAAISKAKEDEAAEEAAREAALNEPFEAEIVGPFSGWSGKTVFTLSNGQVWRQRTGSDYRHTAKGQTVAVKKNFMGYWTLTVLSSGRTVGVRRID
jgi:hypothetical protein